MNSQNHRSRIETRDHGREGIHWGWLMTTLLAITSLTVLPLQAQENSPGDQSRVTPENRLQEVVVSATRSEKEQKQLPESVTVLDREEIENEMAISNDLGAVLGKHVPGFSPSNQSTSNFGQTLRGRGFLTLIDGVPQTTPLRDGARDLHTIDPSSIKRIEIVRGSTSIYGYNSAGGVVNIITEDPGKGEFKSRTVLELGGSEHDLDDSWMSSVQHRIRGASGKNQFLLSGKLGVTNSFFDGQGDRIPSEPRGQGGLAESDRYQLSAKWKHLLSAGRSLSLNLQSFQHWEDRDYTRVPGDVSQGQKTTTRPGAPDVVEDPGTENDVVQLTYSDTDLLGFESSAKIYYQDYLTRYDTGPFFGTQTFITSEKIGGRLTFTGDVQLTDRKQGNLVWGLDYLEDETQQKDERGFTVTPLMTQSSWAPFAQLEIPLGEDFLVRGGLRHEDLTLDIETFTRHPSFGGGVVTGGELDYSETVGNLGAVYFWSDSTEVYLSFSQGFSVADIGRTLRSTPTSSVNAASPEAQIVDNYELGLRRSWQDLQYDLTAYYNESDLGTSYSFIPGSSDLVIQRLPEKIWGVEATVDYDPQGVYSYGGTASWQEGKQDPDNDGTYGVYLDGNRIPPLKLSGYLEYAPGTSDLAHRLQAQFWGERDRFGNSPAYAQGDVDSELLLDYLATYKLGRGRLKFGVENLLDEFYFPVASQVRNLDSSFTAGRGRHFQITWQYPW